MARDHSLTFLLVVCILTGPTGSSKYGTTRKNTQRYYTTKRLIRYIYFNSEVKKKNLDLEPGHSNRSKNGVL